LQQFLSQSELDYQAACELFTRFDTGHRCKVSSSAGFMSAALTKDEGKIVCAVGARLGDTLSGHQNVPLFLVRLSAVLRLSRVLLGIR
jgi:hypothetical protein